MITIYPREYFLIQIIFAQRFVKLKHFFEKAIQDYTNIAQDLLNISKYPPKKEKSGKNFLLLNIVIFLMK